MVDLEAPGQKCSNTKHLRKELHQVLRAHCTDIAELSNESVFPGSQPISLSRDRLRELETCVVCEKSDGVRYFLYVPQTRFAGKHPDPVSDIDAYFVDRRYEFWSTKVLFPRALAQNGPTILDGELVLDNEREVRFLVYDTLVLGGRSYMQNPYLDRLRVALYYAIYPVRQHKGRDSTCTPLFLKDFFEVAHIRFLAEEIIPRLPHANDGLIFTQNKSPYIFGTSTAILKWKPDHLNTIDFSLQEPAPGQFTMHTGSKEGLEPFSGTLSLTDAEAADFSRLLAAKKPLIVECAYHHESRSWKVHKQRTDKDRPNYTGVAANIWKCIQERITLEELVCTCEAPADLTKKRQRND